MTTRFAEPAHHPPTTVTKPAACPGVAAIALAASGKLARINIRGGPACGAMQRLPETANQMAEQLAAWSNRVLYKGHLIWPNDWAWLQPYEKYLGPDAANGLPKTASDRSAVHADSIGGTVRNLRGNTAECGVLGGVGSAMICKTLEGTYQGDERHWGFDSFEGLPEPEKIDIGPQSWQKKGSLAIAPQVALKNLDDFEFCTLVKGWIPQCFEPVRDQRFRLVHIDLDLYQPTVDSLEFFYPRMESSGVFVMDDYGHLTCPGVRQAVDEFSRQAGNSH